MSDEIGSRKMVYYADGKDGLTDEMHRIMNVALKDVPKDQIHVLKSKDEVSKVCSQNLKGASHCYGAIEWHNIDLGKKVYNYTIRGNSGLEYINIPDKESDMDTWVLPLQWAVDKAITNMTETPSTMPYTQKTEKQNQEKTNGVFTKTTINWIAPALFVAMLGVIYHLTGAVALERELGMSNLLSCMGVNTFTRFFSYHVSFTTVYFLSWILIPVAYSQIVYIDCSLANLILYHILSGLSMVSFAIFMGTFFTNSHISGIISSGICVIMAIGVTIQTRVPEDSGHQLGAIYALTFLFPPSNYAYYMSTISRFQKESQATNMIKEAPKSGILVVVIFAAAAAQIFIYFLLSFASEKLIHGSHKPPETSDQVGDENAVRVNGLYKKYDVGNIFKKKPPVIAVNHLTLDIAKGQIMCLLGANGSGKTTTLEMVSGIQRSTSGYIAMSPGSKLGICPQKNVLWDKLSVKEHVDIWCRLKGVPTSEAAAVTDDLINHCDLGIKQEHMSASLSGGQKRKLQLAIMFAGGSNVCCVDEVSSGLDPISRRKIWDIILAKQGSVSIILTTHFLDEADLLSDKIAILSKGNLKAEGTTVHLKDNLGGGYRVYIAHPGTGKEEIVELKNAREVLDTIGRLENDGKKYRVAGPQLEDVFLRVAKADHMKGSASYDINASDVDPSESHSSFELSEDEDSLVNGSYAKRIAEGLTVEKPQTMETGLFKQTFTMIKKRLIVFRRNPVADISAFILPIIVALAVRTFLTSFRGAGCAPKNQLTDQTYTAFNYSAINHASGPATTFNSTSKGYASFMQNILSRSKNMTQQQIYGFLDQRNTLLDTFGDFKKLVHDNHTTLYPGGAYLDPPTLAYQIDSKSYGTFESTTVMNYLNNLRANGTATLITNFSPFQDTWSQKTGETLQFVGYFGLSLGVAPAFASLYPTFEKISKVRAMQYSNGLRLLPLWISYTLFSWVLWIISGAIIIAILGTATDHILGLGYLYAVIVLYGLAGVLYAYVISLFARSQLAAFALVAALQSVLFLLYLLAYLCVEAYASPEYIPNYILIVHYCMSILGPIIPMSRALFVCLNLFGVICNEDGNQIEYLGDVVVYGSPFIYLIVHILVFFSFIIWWESGSYRPNLELMRERLFLRRNRGHNVLDGVPTGAGEKSNSVPPEVTEEIQRVENSGHEYDDGLKLEHVTKVYGKNAVTDDVSFGVKNGECFALLGPNGAGKTTTFNMIRGEGSITEGEILVNGISVAKHKTEARSRLGVCPQFDAMDKMKVVEILKFYAQLRGLTNISYHVDKIIEAVGIDRFRDRMASKLSGGNKRKLSLGIALIGDPSVLLLDEPSSGMDAFAKRIMWKTLSRVSHGRSIVLTTHSMEEADALANRAGILAKKMLTVGNTDLLRNIHGKFYHVHIVCHSAPTTSHKEMNNLVAWIKSKLPGSEVGDRLYQGQIKMSVPVKGNIKVSDIFKLFEYYKDDLGIESYSVASTTLEEVFLRIVGDHNIVEEGYEQKHAGQQQDTKQQEPMSTTNYNDMHQQNLNMNGYEK